MKQLTLLVLLLSAMVLSGCEQKITNQEMPDGCIMTKITEGLADPVYYVRCPESDIVSTSYQDCHMAGKIRQCETKTISTDNNLPPKDTTDD